MGRGRTLASRWPAAVVGVLVGGFLAGCAGGPSPSTPTPESTPAPGPSPTPATTSFLHLRQEGGDVSTYRIDGTTGRLQLALTQRLGDVRALAGDPDGRYVYAAYGPPDRAAAGRQDASIVLYEADPSGRLAGLSEASSRPWETPPYGTDCWGAGWTWLAASRSRVWGLWESSFAFLCHHDSYTSVSHAVTAGGQLGTAVVGGFWEDFGAAALDAEADVLYKSRLGGDYSGTGAMTSHVVWPDGRLKTMGTTSLCVASEVEIVDPLVAVRGYVLGSALVGVWPHATATLCSWEGPRLAPRANLGITGSVAAAFSTADATSRALLAIADDVYGSQWDYRRTDLRLLSVRSDGDTDLLDTVELPSRVRQLLFDPSGRLLFLADEDGRVLSYAVGAATPLEPIESVPASAHPLRADGPSFMAVSYRSSAPKL